jgi:rhodanese-related sulfurtransferase
MAKTFRQMVAEARSEVTVISPQDAQQKMQSDSKAVLVDVREPSDLNPLGIIPGALNVPLGVLPLRADQELPERLREMKLQDRDAQVITTCGGGGQAALAATELQLRRTRQDGLLLSWVRSLPDSVVRPSPS